MYIPYTTENTAKTSNTQKYIRWVAKSNSNYTGNNARLISKSPYQIDTSIEIQGSNAILLELEANNDIEAKNEGYSMNINDDIYVLHQEQNYTITLPEGMELYKNETIEGTLNSWYINRLWYKHTFTGNEALQVQNNGKRVELNCQSNNIPLAKKNRNNAKVSNIYCNILNRSSGDDTWNGVQGISYNGTIVGYLDIAINGISTANQYKQALAGNEVLYLRATPIEEPITDTTLINQLNDLYNKTKTYQGVTHITQTNEELPFVLTLDYKKSNLLRIKVLEEANSGE